MKNECELSGDEIIASQIVSIGSEASLNLQNKASE